MSGAFTPEQEARIAEIIEGYLLRIADQRSERQRDHLDHAFSWARNGHGIPAGPSDD